MDVVNKKIESFKDLIVWQEGHKLVLEVYKHSKQFPRDEQFGLTNQIRRAIVSFTSNLAEGFSRNSYKEKIQFYSISLGSLTEVQNQLMIARDLDYITEFEFNKFEERIIVLSKMTNGLIKKSKSFVKP
jgi:four helix bundle protein